MRRYFIGSCSDNEGNGGLGRGELVRLSSDKIKDCGYTSDNEYCVLTNDGIYFYFSFLMVLQPSGDSEEWMDEVDLSQYGDNLNDLLD